MTKKSFTGGVRDVATEGRQGGEECEDPKGGDRGLTDYEVSVVGPWDVKVGGLDTWMTVKEEIWSHDTSTRERIHNN